MPDYAEHALAAGWKQVGSKWTKPGHPTYYNAIECYRNDPDIKKRPDSITPPERKPEVKTFTAPGTGKTPPEPLTVEVTAWGGDKELLGASGGLSVGASGGGGSTSSARPKRGKKA